MFLCLHLSIFPHPSSSSRSCSISLLIAVQRTKDNSISHFYQRHRTKLHAFLRPGELFIDFFRCDAQRSKMQQRWLSGGMGRLQQQSCRSTPIPMRAVFNRQTFNCCVAAQQQQTAAAALTHHHASLLVHVPLRSVFNTQTYSRLPPLPIRASRVGKRARRPIQGSLGRG